MVEYIPDRGDIVWLNFDPQKGSEIMKTRPALVISPKKYNIKSNLAIFMPITSKVKGYPFETLIELEGKSAAILSDQVRSLDWRVRNAKRINIASALIIKQALDKLYLLIGD